MRSGVCVLAAGFVVLIGALPAAADTTTSATTTAAATTTTTADTTTTTADTTTTTADTTTATADTTTVAPTSTAPVTTAPATTAPVMTTAPAAPPATAVTTTPPVRRPSAVAYAAAAVTPIRSSCASAGAAAIVAPGKRPLAVGAAPARLGAAAYRSVVRFGGAAAAGASCRPGKVTVRSLSLFGGAVTAESVVARDGSGTIAGMQVGGHPVSLPHGSSLALGRWAELERGVRVDGTLAAPLALRLLRPRAGLPAGTTVLVGWTGRAAPSRKAEPATPHARRRVRHATRRKARPLKATPPLGESGYVFPVAGGAAFGDTYGAGRSDIADGWHHGDDLFAPLGTPVVAVASGTLSLIGWEQLGGWRLWLTDAKGNQYYYAHLAGYAPQALHDRHVHAGEVLGFVGRTGDAFTTVPHLHFEVHPVSLLRLGYDGAVDPTAYLHGWRVVRVRRVPDPVLPGRAPAGAPRLEARVVWHELLAARGLLGPPRLLLRVRHPFARDNPVPQTLPPLVRASAIGRPAPARSKPLPPALGAGLLLVLAAGLGTAARRRRRRSTRSG